MHEVHSWILKRLFSFEDNASCFISGDGTYTYACLQREIHQWQIQLNKLDIQPGQVIGKTNLGSDLESRM